MAGYTSHSRDWGCLGGGKEKIYANQDDNIKLTNHTEQCKENLEKSLTLDPLHPLTHYYVGLAAKQAGKLKDALRIWLELQIRINKNVRWGEILMEQVIRLSKTMGISEETLASMRKNMKDKIQKKIK